MKRIHTRTSFTSAMIALTAAACLTLPASVQAELLDDFNDGDDDGWTRLTLPPNLPGARWDASTGLYRLSVDGTTLSGGTVASLLDITTDPAFSNGYWWATVVRETANSTTHLFMRGDLEDENAYTFGWYHGTGLIIQRIDAGFGTVLATDPTFVQDLGTDYILEAGTIGSDLELRMWPLGGDRPQLPQAAATDSTYARGANGVVSTAFSTGDLSATFDDVSFVPEPATLPHVVLAGFLIASRRR